MDPTAPKAPTLDLRDYLRPLWRRKVLTLAIVTFVTVATYVHYEQMPKLYRATTDIYLRTTGVDTLVSGSSDQSLSDRDLQNQARVLRSSAVASRVAGDIGYSGNLSALLDSVVVVPNPDADYMTVAAVATSADGAARLANGFARAFLAQTLATNQNDAAQALAGARRAYANLAGQRSPDPQERQQLLDQINRLQILQSLPTSDVQQLDAAQPPAGAFSPQPRRNTIFALVLSLAFATMAAYGLDRIDRRIHEVDDVKPIYDAPVIATVPRADTARKPPAGLPPSLVEAFRTLRTAIEVAAPVRDGSVSILVTSAVAREGKSTVVRNLGLAFHEAGRRVAIVEADLRRPSLARSLFTAASPGLTDVLQGRASLTDAMHEVVTELPTLDVVRMGNPPDPRGGLDSQYPHVALNGNGDTVAGLTLVPSGSPASDPPTLLGSNQFKVLLEQLEAHFDVVLLDSTPLLEVSDAIPLLADVDRTLIVSRVGKTTEGSAAAVADLMRRISGPPIIGVVANDVAPRARDRRPRPAELLRRGLSFGVLDRR